MIFLHAGGWLALWGILLVAPLLAPAHAQSGTDPDPTVDPMVMGARQLDATDAYRLAILEMKGQLSVARALLQLRAPGADYFMQQPMQDIFRSAAAEFADRDAPFTADFLEQLEFASEGDPITTLSTVELAVNALDGSFAQTGGVDVESALALAEALLRGAVARYAQAVVDNEVVDLRQYQSGRGLVTEAEALVRYHGGLRGQPNHEELLKVVTLIRQAWPAVIPPQIVFDPPSVIERLDQAVSIMEELR